MAKKIPPVANGAVPEFLRVVVAKREPASARAAAEQAVLALNSSMMTLYDETLEKYKRNMRDQVPIILALFTGQGGQMILYRPGHEPLIADPVPIVYQLAKSVGHSSMAIYQVVAPYLGHPPIPSWRAPLQVYRTQNQLALDSLAILEITKTSGRSSVPFSSATWRSWMNVSPGGRSPMRDSKSTSVASRPTR
jgi:hypothetical protein